MLDLASSARPVWVLGHRKRDAASQVNSESCTERWRPSSPGAGGVRGNHMS